MRESEIIQRFAAAFPRSPRQQNRLQTCDAEIIPIGGEMWAVTVDEFSPEEDRFTSCDPQTLGANLATATLSDLFAAGAVPAWYLHSVVLPYHYDAAFLDDLAQGMSTVLAQAGCALCGGDLGRAESWRYCGVAMGRLAQSAVMRLLPDEPHVLWISGPLGDANLAALTGAPTPRFELRLESARLLREHATAAIDTSGGLFDAIWTLHELTPHLRITLDLDALPLAPGVVETANMLGIPPQATLLGGAGEYELLFAVPAASEASVEDALCAAGAVPIGATGAASESGIVLSTHAQPDIHLTQSPPCAREYASLEAYIHAVTALANELFLPSRIQS